MPSDYSRVATVEDVDEHGLPTSPPPSFEYATASSGDLSHKNDNTATIMMPQSAREKNIVGEFATFEVTDAGSEDRDMEAMMVVSRREQLQKRWVVGMLIFVLWLSGMVVYGGVKKMCMKTA